MELRTDRYKLKELFPDKAKKYAQKLKKKAGTLEFIRKGIPIDPKDIEIKEGERAAIRLVTTPHLDRDSEILIPHGAILDDFRQSPSVLYAHDYKGLPVGHDQWIKSMREGILAKTLYANHQFAEDVYQCVKHKDLNANSVGFIPIETASLENDKKEFSKWQDVLEKDYGILKEESGKAKAIYTKWIMLEHSDVPVASNAQSLNLAVSKGEVVIKSDRLKKDLEIEVVKDREIVVEIDDTKYARVKEYTEGMPRRGKEIEVVKRIREFKNTWKDKPSKPRIGDNFIDEDTEKVYKFDGKNWIIKSEIIAKAEVITKPETIGDYHHIPVNPGCKITATITISAKEGIKATYCGKIKKIHTYLFDIKKWTMSEAQAWVREHKDGIGEMLYKHFEEGIKYIVYRGYGIEAIEKEEIEIKTKEPEYKERWNKSLSKVFDVAAVEAPIATFSYALYEKFLECKVKEIFLNGYSIPSPLLGTYLAGFKKILGDFKLKDTRSFTWNGFEVPPVYEVIKLNSEKSDDFLIDGVCFYDAGNKPLIVRFRPTWGGINVSIVTSNENKEWNKELLDKVHSWAYENNYLRGEKFALSGEFLDEPGDNWDNLILDAKYKDSIVKSANFLEKKGKELTGRGLLFVGPPGTGKTKTGRVLMNELDATFIWVSSKDFRHIGPLKALVLGFSLARDLAPSILFLEDIDTWLRGEMEFVTDLIKTEMDGIKQNKGLITIMTSNYPEKLPDALLDRPGRFHHIINFELPKEKERSEMLKLWAGDIEEKLLDDIVEKTEGFSGAHLKELVEFAKMIAEEEEIEIGDALLKSLDKLIEQRELIEEIRDNQAEAKELWGKVKWVDGNVEIKADSKVTAYKTYQKICNEHKWVDITTKDERPGRAWKCTECGDEYYSDTEEFPPDFDEQGEPVDYTNLEFAIKDLTSQVAELKEGRVLSTKNRTLVKDTIDALTALKEKLDELYSATEPPSREEEKETEPEKEKEVVLEMSKKETDMTERIASILEETLKGEKIASLLKTAVDDVFDIKIKKKLGKVD